MAASHSSYVELNFIWIHLLLLNCSNNSIIHLTAKELQLKRHLNRKQFQTFYKLDELMYVIEEWCTIK